MRKPIYWILNFTDNLPNDEERIKCLQANGVEAVKIILKYAFDPRIKWLLPEGAPPYTPSENSNMDSMLYSEARKFYLFVEGGNDNLNQIKRERIFIDILENIHPEDAKLVLNVKDKKLPYKNIGKRLVKKAFPELFA